MALWLYPALSTLAAGLGTILIAVLCSSLVRWSQLQAAREARRGQGVSAPEEKWVILTALVGGLFAGLGISVGLTGRLIYGLSVLLPMPWVLPIVRRAVRAARAGEVERAALSFFHALGGLLRAGISLPSALFQLTERREAPFQALLGRHLRSYAGGRSLAECLSRFRGQARLARVGPLLALLESAYSGGLSLLPVLDAMLPVLEEELLAEGRVRELRKAAVTQITIATAIPWALAAWLGWFQPELIDRVRHSSYLYPLVGGVLALELAGGWTLWRVSQFP